MIQALATRYRALAAWDIGSLVTGQESCAAAAQRSGGRSAVTNVTIQLQLLEHVGFTLQLQYEPDVPR
jgi:hypothetical protein